MFQLLVRRSIDGGIPVLLVVLALAVGTAGLLLTAREEEPQIVVPSADVMVAAPSLSARQVERLVATPLEKLLTQIDGVEHVYSTSEAGRAVVTVRFYVGEDREDSLLKLYSKVYSHQDVVTPAVTGWVVKPVEVDDVPVLTATLFSEREDIGGYELRRLAEEVATTLQSIPETNRIEVIGGPQREFQVLLDSLAMAGRATAIDDVLLALSRSNLKRLAGEIDRDGTRLMLEIDSRVRSVAQLRDLTVNVVDGAAVRLGDVATVLDGPAEPTSYNWLAFAGSRTGMASNAYPAVNIAVAKKRGANAVAVCNEAVAAIEALRNSIFPSGVGLEVTRNYGATANQKITDLLGSLGIAVLVVTTLVGLLLGWRAAIVVAIAVPVCYGITIGLGYVAGYTINRVTLFALILALGLLVDDPITGVDNMERHLGRTDDARTAVFDAMMEIKTPLLMSTFAIVIVFAPMSFITGMMGPYMSPMAFNVPVAVVASTLIAFLLTPWLGLKLLRASRSAKVAGEVTGPDLYARLLTPFLLRRRYAIGLLAGTAVCFLLAISLPAWRAVPLKLLPFDNKNEFQIVIDGDEGTTLEATDGLAREIASYLSTVPEVRAVNAYIGNHAPMDFNGLTRRYYLREQPHLGELHVLLVDKLNRTIASHALILRLRPDIERLAARAGASVKLVNVPPGPPVIATLVAEHYGQPTTDYAALIAAARTTAARLESEPGVVDVDVSAVAPSERWVFVPDQEKAALSGVSAAAIATALATSTGGAIAGFVAIDDEASPLPIRVRLPYAQREALSSLFVKGQPGIAKVRSRGAIADAPTPLVSLSEVGEVVAVGAEQPIFHKDLRPVAYAYAEVAGRVPAAVIMDIGADRMTDGAPARRSDAVPRPLAARTYLEPGGGLPWSLPTEIELRWNGEGEWQVTLRVFRDLGIAFAVALVGLFGVIRLQTGRSMLTAIIMLAIPLVAIGVMPGFWALGKLVSSPVGEYADPVLFTATAMIGMIALAGIVVRNSLILVEFVEQSRAAGSSVDDALLAAGRMRTRPVLLTAGTTVLGNVVITLDPIFAGLAWAVIFGVVASTAFTLLVVPIVYKLAYGGADESLG